MPGDQIPQNQTQQVNVASIAAKYKSKYEIHVSNTTAADSVSL